MKKLGKSVLQKQPMGKQSSTKPPQLPLTRKTIDYKILNILKSSTKNWKIVETIDPALYPQAIYPITMKKTKYYDLLRRVLNRLIILEELELIEEKKSRTIPPLGPGGIKTKTYKITKDGRQLLNKTPEEAYKIIKAYRKL